MLIAHFQPGHLTYEQVRAEALDAFGTYVHARETWQQAAGMAERYRDAAGEKPKDKDLTQAWQDAAHIASLAGTTYNDARLFLGQRVREAGFVDNPYSWIEVKIRALELEAEAPDALEVAS